MCNRPLRVGAWQWGGCVGERELSPPTQEMVVGREESCQDWPSNPAGLRCPHPGEAGISRRVWNPLQKVARDAGKGGWRKDRVNLPTRDQEEKVGAGGFEEPLYSFPLTRTSWIQPRPPGGGAGKGGVSNWLKAEGTSDHPTLCNDGALTTHHHRPTMGWIPPRWIKPIILLWSRSELGSSPGLTRQKHINHSPPPPTPGTPESPPVPDPFCTFLRGNLSFKLAWSGRRAWKSSSSRRMHGSFSPAAPSRSARGSARGEAAAPLPPPAVAARTRTCSGLLSDPHPPRRGRLAQLLSAVVLPTHPTPTPLIPPPFPRSLGTARVSGLRLLFHGEKQGTKPKLCSPFSTSMVKRGRICPFYLQKRNFKVRLPSDSSTQYIFQTQVASLVFSQSCMLEGCGAMDLFFFFCYHYSFRGVMRLAI